MGKAEEPVGQFREAFLAPGHVHAGGHIVHEPEGIVPFGALVEAFAVPEQAGFRVDDVHPQSRHPFKPLRRVRFAHFPCHFRAGGAGVRNVDEKRLVLRVFRVQSVLIEAAMDKRIVQHQPQCTVFVHLHAPEISVPQGVLGQHPGLGGADALVIPAHHEGVGHFAGGLRHVQQGGGYAAGHVREQGVNQGQLGLILIPDGGKFQDEFFLIVEEALPAEITGLEQGMIEIGIENPVIPFRVESRVNAGQGFVPGVIGLGFGFVEGQWIGKHVFPGDVHAFGGQAQSDIYLPFRVKHDAEAVARLQGDFLFLPFRIVYPQAEGRFVP